MPTSPSEAAGAAETTGRAPHGPRDVDLVVIGAGPAGLAGAVAAGELGLSVALLDAAELTGGQYYRSPAPGLGARRPDRLHHAWSAYAALRRRLDRCPTVSHLPRHHVWSALPGHGGRWVVHALTGPDGTDPDPVTVTGRGLLLATGSVERQLPFPGWTLPGVVSAGGAQAMLKSGLVLPGRRVVVAGSGPLLLAVAASLAAAGADVPAVVEAAGYLGYARRPRALLANPGKAAEGLGHGAALLRHRVAPLTGRAVIAAHGTDRVEAVTVARLDRRWRPVPGSGRRIACDALAVGHGLVPQIDLATTLGCAVRRTVDGTYAVETDRNLRTSLPTVWTAGECRGIGGAELALAEGELAGLAAAARLGGTQLGAAQPDGTQPDGTQLDSTQLDSARLRDGTRRPPAARAAALRRRISRVRRFADAMAAVHAPGPGWTEWLTDDTDVCRCEEVPARRIREAVELGARDARTVKLLTRAGMGWCQGRVCSTAVTCLSGAAPAAGAPAPDRRPLSTPVPLSALAQLPSVPDEFGHGCPDPDFRREPS